MRINTILALRCSHLNGRFEDYWGRATGGVTATSTSRTVDFEAQVAKILMAQIGDLVPVLPETPRSARSDDCRPVFINSVALPYGAPHCIGC